MTYDIHMRFAFPLLLISLTFTTIHAQSASDRHIQKLIRDLNRNAVTERMNAVVQLGEIGPPARAALPMLNSAYKRERNPGIKKMMLEAIASISGESGGDKGGTATDAKAVAEKIVRLLEQLDDGNKTKRRYALGNLKKLGALAEPALTEIRKVAKDDDDAVTRRVAGSVVKQLESDLWFLTSKSSKPKSGKTNIEKRINELVGQLILKLDDKSAKVRLQAAKQLPLMGAAAEPAIEKLSRLALDDDSPTNRRTLGLIVRKIQAAVASNKAWYAKHKPRASSPKTR
jgi:hypothetical protein